MSNNKKRLEDLSKKLEKGLELAHQELLTYKKRKGSPLVVSKNGEIKELDPNEVQLTDDPDPKKNKH